VGSRSDYQLIQQQGPSPGQAFAIGHLQTLVIGRDQTNDIAIVAPAVSRRHARITRRDQNFFIEDLGSSNGTFVNDQQLAGPRQLQPGDQIRLGQSIQLQFVAPESMVQDQAAVAQPVAAAQPPVAARPVVAETEAYDVMDEPGAHGPPQLVVDIAGVIPNTYTLTEKTYTLGRASGNDIIISSQIVSRQHARLVRDGVSYRLEVLPEASNPILFEGRPLTQPRRLRHGDKLRIGSQDPGMMATLFFILPAEEHAAAGAQTITFADEAQLAIGRDPQNDVVLDAPGVSRFHAEVQRIGQRFRLRDLRSYNGTFVNAEQISGDVWLKPNDTIRIGPYRFVMGQASLDQFDESKGLRVQAAGLQKWVRKDLNILQDISLVFQPREFVVVVGQSGGGKSTLVDAISGYRPATDGQVQVNEVDVYHNFDAIRNDIGYVPQRDIIHMELTIYQALDYTAQLRMPADTTKEERHQRITEVLTDLDLLHRKDVQISGLSGGQQKRVSIAVELLTKPGLFFLDEPTSGLDPGTETSLMQLMRRLADQGRTIVLITHATKNVMLADKVVFLARGGYLVWFGPPDEALAYFDQYRSERQRRAGDIEFDEIYGILEDTSQGSPEAWAERFRNHPAHGKYINQALQPVTDTTAMPRPKNQTVGESTRRVSSLRQFRILSARNLKILTRDRFSLVLMLAAAPLVSLLGLVLASVLGRNPYGFNGGYVPHALTTLFLLVVYGMMVGGLAPMREIVKEQDVYKRERLVNLKIVPYVMSKVWVAGLLSLYTAAAYIIVQYLAFEMPGGPTEFILMYITLVLTSFSGMMLGLFASALSPTPNAAPLIVILLILPQLVLSGALVPLPTYITAPTATRWGFQALTGIAGIGSSVSADACWLLPDEQRALLTAEDKQANCSCLGTNLLRQESCNFPGLGDFYTPAIDEAPPEEPPPLGEKPAEPVLPPQPEEPPDDADAVAKAEYAAAVQTWLEEVQTIQEQSKVEFAAYEAEAQIFQAQMVDYQTELINWQIARAAAVEPAEGLVGQVKKDFGWTFVDKDDTAAYGQMLVSTWSAQLIISGVLFGLILLLIKRKDVT
jgi:ABC-type multidrug transport system ATPase subunit